MRITEVSSNIDLREKITDLDIAYVLLYKKGSEISECSVKNIQKVIKDHDNIYVFTVDVNTVRDIHSEYNITSVPALLVFKKGQFLNTIKGCNDAGFYKSIFENNLYSSVSEGKQQKRITVYTTPTCSWCTTLKTYLRKHGVRYSEIDVSQNQNEAENMTRKSGQRGVPQTDINGHMIVGFDKTRINELLEISE
ncbi:glutaredoxin domain-containing protein [Bacteroidota bacterium]